MVKRSITRGMGSASAVMPGLSRTFAPGGQGPLLTLTSKICLKYGAVRRGRFDAVLDAIKACRSCPNLVEPWTQRYCCVMIPACIRLPGIGFGILPPGIHWATLEEIGARFACNHHRAWLFEGVKKVALALRHANCSRMYLDGSFVTEKIHPGDFDGCWDPAGVNGALLDPVLLDFNHGRAAQKLKYRGEMFISSGLNEGTETFVDFFQREKLTGSVKGIIGVDLQQMDGALR
jgi:hypothetical protein